MAWLIARIDLDERARDFQRIALRPGFPLLDRFSANSHIVREWLGPFAAESSWDEQTVRFLYRNDQDARPPRGVAPARPADLAGVLRKDVEALRAKLRQAAPKTPSDRALLSILQQRFESAVTDESSAGSLFKVRVGGNWRLVWCWGYDRRRQTSAPLTMCPNDECRLAFVADDAAKHRCSRCGTRVGRRGGLRALALVVLLAALSAGGWWGWQHFPLGGEVVAGAVVDAVTGKAIAGATVRTPPKDGRAPLETQTDGEGHFSLTARGQPVTFEIAATGYQPLTWTGPTSAAAGSRERIALFGASTLGGVVVEDGSDAPVPFATVQVLGSGHQGSADDGGLFLVPSVPSGTVDIEASAPGYQSTRVTRDLAAGRSDDLLLALQGAATADGVVVDAFNKAPVANATVRVAALPGDVRTGSAGEFRREALPGKTLRFEVSAAGYLSRDFERPLSPEGTTTLRFLLRPELSAVAGIVVDASGQPIGGAAVRATDEARAAVMTAADGQFELAGLRHGQRAVTVEAQGYQPLSTKLAVPAADQLPARVVLQGTSRLTGRVTDAVRKAPVKDAEVRIAEGRWKTTTDADGHFAIDDLPAGTATVNVIGRGYRAVDLEHPLTAGESRIAVELRGGTVLSGKVTAQRTGTPIAGAKVRVEGLPEPLTTDPEGRFRLDDAVAGPVKIAVEAEGYKPASAEGEAKTDEEASFELALQGAAALRGQVLSADTKQPIPHATVSIEGLDTPLTAGADGEFLVDDLPAKPLRLTASADGFASDTTDVEPQRAGDTPVTLKLKPPFAVAGVVVDATSQQPIPGAQVTIAGVAAPVTSDDQGRFRVVTAPASNYEFGVTAPGYPPQTFIEAPTTDAAKLLQLPLQRDAEETPAASVAEREPTRLSPRDDEGPMGDDEFSGPRSRSRDPLSVSFMGTKVKAANVGFVVDFSGSMAGERIERTKLELLEALLDMNSAQRFYVSLFNDGPINMLDGASEPLRAAPVEKVRVWNWIKSVPANGGTNPEPSLLHVSKMDPEAIFLMSDGVFTPVADSTFDEFQRHRNHVPTIAFEDEAGKAELQRIAQRTGGTYRFVPAAPIPYLRELTLLTRLFDQLLDQFLDPMTATDVAQDAHDGLKELCNGEDFGPPRGASDPQKQRAKVDWQRWWAENKVGPALRAEDEVRLKKRLANRSPWSRWGAMEALHENGHKTPDTYLKLVKDKDPGINQGARRILQELSDGEDYGPQEFADVDGRNKAYNDWKEWSGHQKYMASFDKKNDSQLVHELQNPSPAVRRKAAQTIEGRTRSSLNEAIVQPLIQALTDSDKDVRQSARQALVKMSGKDFGPAYGASDSAAQTAAKDWQQWLTTRMDGEAAKKFAQAEMLDKAQRKDSARERYREIVDKYPGTASAEKARVRIAALGGTP